MKNLDSTHQCGARSRSLNYTLTTLRTSVKELRMHFKVHVHSNEELSV